MKYREISGNVIIDRSLKFGVPEVIISILFIFQTLQPPAPCKY